MSDGAPTAARGPSGRSARLRDGSIVTIRAVTDADLPALSTFLTELSLEARRLRFFTGGVDVERIAPAVGATGPDRLGLVALDRSGALAGHALCIEVDHERAEVAVEVADHMHGQGLGTILVERLAQSAERRGIKLFVAQVLPENRAMLDVFRDGFDAHVTWSEGLDAVEFPTRAWRLARRRYPSRRVGQ